MKEDIKATEKKTKELKEKVTNDTDLYHHTFRIIKKTLFQRER